MGEIFKRSFCTMPEWMFLYLKVKHSPSNWLGLPVSGILVRKAPATICYTFSMVIFRVSPFFKS